MVMNAKDAVLKGRRMRTQLFGVPLAEDGIAVLEERFGCGLPCFQRMADGGYDQLDAMRRDAYREVTLWLRHQLSIYRKELSNE